MKLLVPFGTRPEMIKLAPVVSGLRSAGVAVQTVATGQQEDPALVDAAAHGLELGIDVQLRVPGAGPTRLPAMLRGATEAVAAYAPDAVLVLGDTNTVPMFCLAARAALTPVVHLEAGLRSYNERSVEEVNRRVAAATASLHLAPTERAAAALRSEGVPSDRIEVVGNPALDSVRTSGVTRVPLEQRQGVAFTAHRATNVDDPCRLAQLARLLHLLALDCGPVTFPCHPRTAERLREQALLSVVEQAGVRLVAPLTFPRMLELVARSRVVVTDSGGLQEEASWFGVPVVVLRRSTPRWESVASGAAVVVGVDAVAAHTAARRMAAPAAQQRIAALPCPYGDGHTAERTAACILAAAARGLLTLREPYFVGKPAPPP